MKQRDIRQGGVYVAKVSRKLTRVRVERIGHRANGRKVYVVTNLATGRVTEFRSAQRFRRPAEAGPVVASPRPAKPVVTFREGHR